MDTSSLKQITDSDIKLIRNFIVVVEQRGLSEASFVLNTHLSTLSNSIAKLESRLGFVLCQRGNKGFKLTEKGAHFYKESLKLIQSIEQYRENVNQIITSGSGSIRIGVLSGSISQDPFQLERIFARYKKLCSEVKINLFYMSNITLVTELLNNKVDFIFYSSLAQHEAIESIRLSDRTSFLYCHKSHLLFNADASKISAREISRCETVRLLYGRREDYEAVNPAVIWNFTASSNTLKGCLTLMKSANFLGMIPECEMDQLEDAADFRKLNPCQFRSVPLYNYLGYLKGNAFTPNLQKFLTTVQETLAG